VPDRYAVPRSYAVVIGISDYQLLQPGQDGGPAPCEFSLYRKDIIKTPARPASDDELVDLRFSHCDAESIYRELISAGGGFRAENVRKLIGPRATRANLRRELEEWLPAVTRENDRIFVYFSGHGLTEQDKAYLAPYDFNPRDVARTGYSMDALAALLRGLKAKDKVLLADACHSGALNLGLERVNQALRDLDRSVFSLTASSEAEKAQERDRAGGGHGVFTYYAVKGMQGEADDDKNGIITAAELAQYVQQNVREVTRGRQNPSWAQKAGDPRMAVAYVPDRWPKGQPGVLNLESELDGVRVFVDDLSRPARVVEKNGLRLEGLTPGVHMLMAEKEGYARDGPREEMVYPGRESVARINLVYRTQVADRPLEMDLERYVRRPPRPDAKTPEPVLQFATLILSANLDGVEVYLDGESRGVLQKDKVLSLSGLRPGARTLMAVKTGYRRFGPREEVLDPGEPRMVTIDITDKTPRKETAEKELDEGIREYVRGNPEGYERARKHFERALEIDKDFSQAELYLGRVHRASLRFEEAQRRIGRALDLEPGYDEARLALAGVLLDVGAFERAIEQVNIILQRLGDSQDRAWALLAQAFRLNNSLANSVEAARQAVEVNAKSLQGHVYLAEALRMSWNEQNNRQLLQEAVEQYETFLRLSDFESTMAGKVFNYWLRGLMIGGGRKTRPSHQDAWKMLRGLAFYGLGDAKLLLKRPPEEYIDPFHAALLYDDTDALTYFGLGYGFVEKFNNTGRCEDARAAQEKLRLMFKFHPPPEEAGEAKGFLAKIDKILAGRQCR